MGNIQDSIKDNAKYNRAISLLKCVLLESWIENDFDQDIYDFLKENDELPDGYIPYWADAED